MEVDTTTISEKGQVIIPSEILKEVGIKKSDTFFIFGEGDTIVLKRKEQVPLKKKITELTQPLQKVVEKEGFTRTDLTKVIKNVRHRT